MMSATSSGGVSSIVSLIVSTICWTDGSMASRIWSAPTSTLRGRPVRRSRPRRVTRWTSHSPGYADAIAILMSSAVRSPRNRLYSRRAKVTMSWSISSPPMRMLRLTTIPPRLMTATSVVPPPMSTMRLPDGSLTGSPAPIAAAIGSSMRRTQRAPALRPASRTARFSTSVTPDGMPRIIRGRGMRPRLLCTSCTKYRIICSVTSKSLMTPSRSGRTAMMLAGVRPTIRLASAPIARTRFERASIATTDGSLMTMPRSFT